MSKAIKAEAAPLPANKGRRDEDSVLSRLERLAIGDSVGTVKRLAKSKTMDQIGALTRNMLSTANGQVHKVCQREAHTAKSFTTSSGMYLAGNGEPVLCVAITRVS